MAHKYYLDKPRDYDGGLEQIWGRGVWTVRQTRFLGKPPHSHDVMVADSNLERLRETTPDHWDVEWSIKVIDQDGVEIKVGDTVYENRRGWSSVPVVVLEHRTAKNANGTLIDQAVCKVGVYAGVYSNKHDCYVCAFYVGNLTHESGRMGIKGA